jgi:ATP-dependent Lon protease
MTGEITLRGNVLPIGGLKEKILAARRAGITTLVIPKLNQKELDEVPAHLKRQLAFHLVESVDEILRLALIPPLESRPVSGAGARAVAKPFPAKHRIKPVTV